MVFASKQLHVRPTLFLERYVADPVMCKIDEALWDGLSITFA